MAVTVTLDKGYEDVSGTYRHNRIDTTFSSSYTSAGEAVTARALGLNTVVGCPDVVAQGYIVSYNIGTGKLNVSAAFQEVAAGTDLSVLASVKLFPFGY